MLKLSRILVLVLAAAFVTGGATLAQNPPPQGQPPSSASQPQAKKKVKGKCSQTPKGCHKNKAKPKTPSNGSMPPGGMPNGMPVHTPSP